MSNEDLKEKAVSIKGKDYVLVKDRILAFNELYPKGCITTELQSYENGQVVMKAIVTPDAANPARHFTGYSQAKESQSLINKQAALENAETSAVGRALAMMGIGVIDSVASADEMHKAGVVTKDDPDFGTKEPLPWEQPEEKLSAKEREMKEAVDAAEAQFKPAQTKTCWKCDEIATFREGMSKTGKPWKAYFCASDNRDHAEFLS